MSDKEKYFVFSVPASLVYEVKADTEEEAREILEEQEEGGEYSATIDIDYANADYEMTYEM